MKLVRSLVWTVLTYGPEGWTLKKADEKRIESAEMWIYRRLLRVGWTEHRTDESILLELNTTRLLLGFETAGASWWSAWSRGKWAGSEGMEDKRRHTVATSRNGWMKHGANNEGHTRSRWMEKIDKMCGTGHGRLIITPAGTAKEKRWLSGAGEYWSVRDAVVPADAHNAAEGFYVEGVDAFFLGFGKCPRGWAVGDYRDSISLAVVSNGIPCRRSKHEYTFFAIALPAPESIFGT